MARLRLKYLKGFEFRHYGVHTIKKAWIEDGKASIKTTTDKVFSMDTLINKYNIKFPKS